MSQQQYQTLFAYTAYTTQKLLEQAALLDEADYHAQSEIRGKSIHDLFFHLLLTSRGWRVALESGTQPARLQASDYPTLKSIQAGFAADNEAWKRLLSGLTDEQVDGPIRLTTARGETALFEYWRVLQHLLFHSMQHHTELAHLLTAKGHSPGDIDFLFYPG